MKDLTALSKFLMALLLVHGVVSSYAFAENANGAAEEEEGTTLNAQPLSDAKHSRYLNMYIGIDHDEPMPSISGEATFKGDYKKVAKVQFDRDKKILRFVPLKEGIATITIHDPKDSKPYVLTLDVKKNSLTKVAREIRALLSDIEGIQIKIINNKVVVDGQILLPRDMNRIHSVVKEFDGQASTLVVLSPIAQRKIAQMIQAEINSPEITVRAINEKFLLEGVATDQQQKDQAEIIAKTYVPDIVREKAEADGVIVKLKKDYVVNLITLKPAAAKDPGKIIQIVVHYVEMNKNYQKGFNFQFTPSLADNSSVSFTNDSRAPSGVISTITGTISNLLPKLNWAKTHGHARVLESSSLIILDGQKGDLKSTVRLPYQVVDKNGQPSTNFEEAGLITTITPKIINPRSDSISMSLEFAMRNLLGITDKGPMISNSSMQTVVIVRSGQSAAVGGLISNSSNTDYNKLPKGAAENPIISLHTSKSFQRNQSQFVVFVTPIIKSSASAGAEKIKRKFKLSD